MKGMNNRGYCCKKGIMVVIFIFLSIFVLGEKVVMVFPDDDQVIVLFDDHSWFYHSQITWYDMVDFIHYDEQSGFAVLEETSFRIGENQIKIQGIAMNTSEVEKRCEIAYTLFGENQEYLANEKLVSRTDVQPGHLFHFEITFDDVQGVAKYVKFDYIQNFEE